jgi:hypothetical protein
MQRDATRQLDARRLPWYGWVGGGALLGGELAVAADVLFIRGIFYQLAWWAYILLTDALVWQRQGRSLLRTAPHEFWVLAFWSVPCWCVFELLNFRLENWSYVNVPPATLANFFLSLLAFATVLPGLFETESLLAAYGLWEKVRCRPRRIGRGLLAGSILLGAAMLALVLLVPRAAFPLAWGFAVFLFDPICYRRNHSRSLLGQWEAGDPRTCLRLLAAGVICGGLWEFWNYWAYTKWLYTVPGLDRLKWFEMPPLGFLGFPPFALECYVLVNSLNLFRRGRGWEHPQGTGAPRAGAAMAVSLALAFDVAVFAGIDRWTLATTAPRMEDLDGVGAELSAGLEQASLSTPPAFLKAIAQRGTASVARQTGADIREVTQAAALARLADLKGLGAENANSLYSLGIRSVEQLARQEPAELLPRWHAATPTRPPRAALVRLWIRAARREVGPSP